MEIHIPQFKEIESMSIVGARNESVTKIDLEFDGEQWIADKQQTYDWYFYLINDQFPICNSFTSETIEIKENLFATVSTYDEKESDFISKLKIKTNICSQIDNKGLPTKVTSIFSNYDPLVILSLSISIPFRKTIVVYTEWLFNGKSHWITSKPFDVDYDKITYNSLKISTETPKGQWLCNVYMGTKLFAQHEFTITNDKTLQSPRSAFIDSKY